MLVNTNMLLYNVIISEYRLRQIPYFPIKIDSFSLKEYFSIRTLLQKYKNYQILSPQSIYSFNTYFDFLITRNDWLIY